MSPMTRYQKILVPLDGSGWSQRALPHAVDIAMSNKSELILLSIFSAPAQTYTSELALAGQQSALDELRQSRILYLSGLCNELRESGITTQYEVVDGSDAAASICNYVRASNIDLVVMSTHGRTGLARMIFGSVARAVMECAQVPTLLVHPDKETVTP
ncbi:MAG: UspA domain-containing protein [Chloroflexi bacterium OLB15]|nr:MAG: UspA domain-containing protein [Chloroflexi bacterium OLB15]